MRVGKGSALGSRLSAAFVTSMFSLRSTWVRGTWQLARHFAACSLTWSAAGNAWVGLHAVDLALFYAVLEPRGGWGLV